MKKILKFVIISSKCGLADLTLMFYKPKDDVVGKKLKEIFKKNFKVYFIFAIYFVCLLATPIFVSNILQTISNLLSIDFNNISFLNIRLSSLFNIGLSFIFTSLICKQMQKIIDASKNSFSISKSTTDKRMLIAAIADGLEKLVGVHEVIKSRKKKKKGS